MSRGPETGSDAGRAIEAVWRIESPRLIAGLARMSGDVGLAEDLAQDALVAALERWPESEIGASTIAASNWRARRGCGWQWTLPSTRRRWAASAMTCSA